jgi:Kef-type K+ transport system membrane component KefB
MEKKRKSSNKRAVVSVGLFILFVLLIVSAVMIQVKEDNPQSFGLHVWTAVHALCGIVFIAFVIFHLVYNWKIFKSYCKRKNQ